MSRLYALFIATSILLHITALSTVNRYMAHYDLTRDGKVDSRELRTIAYMNHKLPPTISDNIFRKADRNGDKFIDHIEIVAAARLIQRHVAEATLRWLEDHDADGDGLLSEAELFESIYMEHGLSASDIGGCFRESDTNKDGHLTFSELVGTLHCSRLLALKEAKELLKYKVEQQQQQQQQPVGIVNKILEIRNCQIMSKQRIYDTDGDHRLNIQEAQVLAELRYDIEPGYATIVFADVNHREDRMINELELIDFLTKLREEAATTALNKLSSLDQNGDKAISFSELLHEYEHQLKKSVLKKIFNKVDVNKNVHIDPIEFISLENVIADEIRLQAMQNDSAQNYSVTENAITSLPALIIFNPSKHKHNQQSSKQRKRRSAPEADTKLMISDQSQPGIRELVASNASNVHFSTVVTAVPKFLKSGEDYQKLLSDGTKIMSELFTNSERGESKNVNESTDAKKIRDKSISDEDISSLNNFASALTKRSRIDENGGAGSENAPLHINDPNMVYVKKFEKFFDFLQKAIKKISKAVKENTAKQDDLQSPLRSINIIKHSNPTADNNSNIDVNETTKIAATVVQKPIVMPTTTIETLKISKNFSSTTHEKARNEKNLIVHTPIDGTEYKTVMSKKFDGLFSVPFLQFREGEDEVEVKMINYEGGEHEGEDDTHNSRNVAEKNEMPFEDVDERNCTLDAHQTDSSNSDDSSAQSAKLMKQHKCNTKIGKSNGISSKLLRKISTKSKKMRLPSESNKESENQTKRKQNLQDKLLAKTNSLKASLSSSKHSSNETTREMIPDAMNDDKASDASAKRSNFNETSTDDQLIHESLHSQLTADRDDGSADNESDSTRPEKVSAKRKGHKLLSSRGEVNVSGEKAVNEFASTALTLVMDKQSKGYAIPELLRSTGESAAIDRNDRRIHPQAQTTNSQEQPQLPASKSQTVSNASGEEDELFDEVLNDILNVKISELHRTTISNVAKSNRHMANDSQTNTMLSLKLEKNDTILQMPEIPTVIITTSPSQMSTSQSSTLATAASSSEISPLIAAANSELFSTTIDDAATAAETSASPDSMNNSNSVKSSDIIFADATRRMKNEIANERSAEVAVIQKKRKNHIQKKPSNNGDDNISAHDVNDSVANATDVIASKKKLRYERRLKAKYQSKMCSSNKRCTCKVITSLERHENASSQSTKATENDDLKIAEKNGTESFHRNFEQSPSQVNDWRRQKVDELLLRVVQEYQAYLRNRENEMRN
ncbi:unnamed protein product [Litomosoides sigmodontis]|uniref:EF-hand domain-containing protein n=1 Tax=Litomosoides sigmodontis TaxID=42156 RepID=A0A3P6UW15_LITSI|nr:unnamed protein product [Litomosoides sigmodontis]